MELVLIVETARGVLAAEHLAHPTERVRRMCFGAYDFAQRSEAILARAAAFGLGTS
jgi:citrate lyase beta subunit